MSLSQDLINELKQEAIVTRKYLERVPFDKFDFKPVEKSESLGRLAIHVAEIVAWWRSCIENSELDFKDFEPENITSTKQLLSYFDHLLIDAIAALSNAQPDVFEKTWSMRNGDTIYFILPKKQVLRVFCMNHLIHHRAQLGIYLRLINVPLPASYGPSAEDEEVIFTNAFKCYLL